jgi:hypothetical protein
VEKTAEDIAIPGHNGPERHSEVSVEYVQRFSDELLDCLIYHRCITEKATAPSWPYPDEFDWNPYFSNGVQLPTFEAVETEEEVEEKKSKWSKFMLKGTYTMDWSSWTYAEKAFYCPVFLAARVADEQGVKFEISVEKDNRFYSRYYREDENTAYFQTVTLNQGKHWYSVDLSTPRVITRAYERAGNYLFDFDYMDYTSSLKYTKSVNGYDVIEGKVDVGFREERVEMYFHPETHQLKFVYLYNRDDAVYWLPGELKFAMELIYEDDLYFHMDYPEETEGIIAYADMPEYQKAIREEVNKLIAGHQ